MAEPLSQNQASVVLALPLVAAGSLLVLLPLTWLGWMLVRRVFPAHLLTAEELAWRQLQPVFASAEKDGLTSKDYSTILTAVKQYFGIAAFTAAEVAAHQQQIAQGAIVTRIVQTCEVDVLCRAVTLNAQQNDDLQKQVEQVIPRP